MTTSIGKNTVQNQRFIVYVENNIYIKMKQKLFTLLMCFSPFFTSLGKDIPTRHEVGATNLPDSIAPICSPFKMSELNYPIFPNRIVNIKDLGAKQKEICTDIIQNAIDQTSKKGGGTILIPKGEWLTGRISLKNNINLHIEEGGILKFSGNIKDYLPVVKTRNEGIELYSLGALIYANNAENIALTGKGKLIGPSTNCEIYKRHMNSTVIEKFINSDTPVEDRIYDGKDNSPIFLPMFVSPINCKNVLIEGVSFEKTIFWHINPIYCENVIIRGITINSVGTPRSDGIDIESTKNVLIEYCTLNCGDDCFTIKSGRSDDGIRVNKPAENIIIRHCLGLKGVGAITCGSETAAMIRNLYVHDCVFEGTNVGILFKTRRNRGGGGENLFYERLRMTTKGSAIKWDMLGQTLHMGNLAIRKPIPDITRLTPKYQNIKIKDIIIEDCDLIINAVGLPEQPSSNILINKMKVFNSKQLMKFQDIDGFVISNSDIQSSCDSITVDESRNIFWLNTKIKTHNPLKISYKGDYSLPIITD